jgi:hypothetical protein
MNLNGKAIVIGIVLNLVLVVILTKVWLGFIAPIIAGILLAI